MKIASISFRSAMLCIVVMATQSPILGAGQSAPDSSPLQEQLDTALRLAKEILGHPIANPELLQAGEEGNITPEEIDALCNGNLYAGVKTAGAVSAQAAQDAAHLLATTAHENSETVKNAIELSAGHISDTARNAAAEAQEAAGKFLTHAAAMAQGAADQARKLFDATPQEQQPDTPLQSNIPTEISNNNGETGADGSPFGKNMLSLISVTRLYQTALYVAAISATVATGVFAVKQVKQFRARRSAARRNTENQ